MAIAPKVGRRALLWIGLWGAGAIVPTASHGATLHVNAQGTGDYPTIQAAIDAADTGDAVVLADGTYTGSGNRDLDYLGKGIVVRSASGDPAACVIDCQGGAGQEHRGVTFATGESAESVLAGVTITRGYVSYAGGAVWCSNGAAPRIEDCIFRDCEALEVGGGVYCATGTAPELIGCAIRENHSGIYGGGIRCYRASPRIVNCTLQGNTSGLGGGLCLYRWCQAEISACVFTGNEASLHAGALYLYDSSPAVSACVFQENVSAGDGAGILCIESAPAIAGCEFRGNVAQGLGAGIFVSYSDLPGLVSCEFTGNQALEGGALYCLRSDPLIEECTFASNEASDGAALLCRDASPALARCTLTGHQSGPGGCAIALTEGAHLTLDRVILTFTQGGRAVNCEGHSAVALTCCDIFGNEAGNWNGCLEAWWGQGGNISADPLFCGPEDYHLHAESPCAPFSDPNPDCDRIGAWDVGCGASPATRASWGAIKQRYRTP